MRLLEVALELWRQRVDLSQDERHRGLPARVLHSTVTRLLLAVLGLVVEVDPGPEDLEVVDEPLHAAHVAPHLHGP